jgi:hypothetical protein
MEQTAYPCPDAAIEISVVKETYTGAPAEALIGPHCVVSIREDPEPSLFALLYMVNHEVGHCLLGPDHTPTGVMSDQVGVATMWPAPGELAAARARNAGDVGDGRG